MTSPSDDTRTPRETPASESAGQAQSETNLAQDRPDAPDQPALPPRDQRGRPRRPAIRLDKARPTVATGQFADATNAGADDEDQLAAELKLVAPASSATEHPRLMAMASAIGVEDLGALVTTLNDLPRFAKALEENVNLLRSALGHVPDRVWLLMGAVKRIEDRVGELRAMFVNAFSIGPAEMAVSETEPKRIRLQEIVQTLEGLESSVTELKESSKGNTSAMTELGRQVTQVQDIVRQMHDQHSECGRLDEIKCRLEQIEERCLSKSDADAALDRILTSLSSLLDHRASHEEELAVRRFWRDQQDIDTRFRSGIASCDEGVGKSRHRTYDNLRDLFGELFPSWRSFPEQLHTEHTYDPIRHAWGDPSRDPPAEGSAVLILFYGLEDKETGAVVVKAVAGPIDGAFGEGLR